ncbi:MAG: InlB B-repeat-containing protein [Clostridia bacterium]|nr:InlB B-repeat-containing protein [Clostridia bacterium]
MKKTLLTRRIVCALALVLGLSLVACKGGGKQSASEPPVVTYKVAFDSYGGTSVSSQTVKEGALASMPTPPTKNGFSFDCWLYGGVEFDFSTPITKNITLTAAWFDHSKFYRVTTCLERAIGNRGTAVIKGEDVSSKRFTEGTEITLVATANEGYAFSAWIDNLSGEAVSTDASYTFKLRADVEIKASFICVVTGLENPANKMLYDALEKTELSDGQIVFFQYSDFGAAKNAMRTEINFNRELGLVNMVVMQALERDGVLTQAEIANLWMRSTEDGYDCYLMENGTLTPVLNVPSAVLDMSDKLTGTGAENKEQVMLTAYNALKDKVMIKNGELMLVADATEYVQGNAKYLAENGNSHVKKLAYDTFSSAWADVMKQYGSFEVAGTKIELSTLTVKGWIETFAIINRVNAQTMLANVKDAYIKAVDSVADVYGREGLPMSDEEKQALIARYDEILKCTVSEAFEIWNTDEQSGSLADVPESATLPYVINYGLLSNFTVAEYYAAIIRALNLNGTAWDANANAILAPMAAGVFTVNGGITGFSFGITEKDGAALINVTYTKGWSAVAPDFPA